MNLRLAYWNAGRAFFTLSVGVLLASLVDGVYEYVRFVEQMLRCLL